MNLGDLQRDLRGLSPTPPNKKKAHLIILYLLHFPALYPLSNVPPPDGQAGTSLPKKYILSLYPLHILISLHLLQASKREPRLMSIAQVLDGFNAQYRYTGPSAYYVLQASKGNHM
jgi:hypothetical protein